jgi:hypothetical protein
MLHPEDGGSKHLWKSASFYETTQSNIPDDRHLHTRYCENLKFQIVTVPSLDVHPWKLLDADRHIV